MIAVPYQGALNTLVVVMILRLIVKEKFQIYLCLSVTFLALGDDSIALKRGFSIEHCIIHLLWWHPEFPALRHSAIPSAGRG